MAKIYKSARGKVVDLDRILNDNEKTRAVGNMNINARGDAIDSKNKIVQKRNQRIQNQYRKQHKSQVADDIVPTSKQHAQKIVAEMTPLDIAEKYVEPVNPKVPSIEDNKEIAVEPPAAIETEVRTQPEPASNIETEVRTQPEPASNNVKHSAGGLAAAIAKARESKQEVMKTERQQAREDEGVKRI